MTTRNDSRYVAHPETGTTYGPGEIRPVLRAWGGADEQSLTMPMGGWTDDDSEAFLAAVQDEARYGGGTELPLVIIERVLYDEDGEVIGGKRRPFVEAEAAQA